MVNSPLKSPQSIVHRKEILNPKLNTVCSWQSTVDSLQSTVDSLQLTATANTKYYSTDN